MFANPALQRFGGRVAIAFVAVAVVTAIALITAERTVADVTAKIERIEVEVDEAPLEAPEAGNYLIVGSDSRAFAAGDAGAENSFGSVEGARGDTLMVAHIDPTISQVLVVSFPRDLLVEIPGRGEAKINAALDFGPDVLVETFRANFGLDIHHYVNVDFASFQTLVDAMGGVSVYIANPIRDWHYDPERGEYVNETGLELDAGCQLLGGEQALAYVRTRYFQENVNGKWQADPTADLGRITRQQQFVRVLMSAARDAALAHPLQAKRLAEAAVSNLAADQALRQEQILGALDTFKNLDPANPESVEMQRLPIVDGGNVPGVGAVVVRQEPQAEALLARMRVFAPPTTTTAVPTTVAGSATTEAATAPVTTSAPSTTRPVSGTPIERC